MRAILLSSLVLLATTAPALAEGCTPTTSEVWVDTGDTPQGRYYVDNDACWWCVLPYITWVYQEANGIDGLQRGDESVDDTCGGMIEPDRIIY